MLKLDINVTTELHEMTGCCWHLLAFPPGCSCTVLVTESGSQNAPGSGFYTGWLHMFKLATQNTHWSYNTESFVDPSFTEFSSFSTEIKKKLKSQTCHITPGTLELLEAKPRATQTTQHLKYVNELPLENPNKADSPRG